MEVGDGYDRWVHQSVGEREAGGDHMTERAREGGDRGKMVISHTFSKLAG